MFLLRSLSLMVCLGCMTASAQDPAASQAPIFSTRVLYAPAHFGNSYEVMGINEMRAYLAECKAYGFNRYADWYDTVDCTSPEGDRFHHQMGSVLWQRKKDNFRSAQDLGLACDLVITPNHVFLDQCTPEVNATKEERIFGDLVCPSKPQGRAIILKNYEYFFADLAAAGVHLNGLWPCPYDYGGCACDACKPWILTFAKLCREIYAIADKYHPGIEMHFIGWWWSAEEHQQFAEWADREAPGWVKSIALHIPYGALDVDNVPLPQGCERQAFLHIGYADDTSPMDIYGQFGPVIAPERLERTLAALKAHGCTGFMAYSEGVFDDVNKVLAAGIGAGVYAAPDAALTAYAKQYLQAQDDTAVAAWTAWLKPWGHPFTVDPETPMPAIDQTRGLPWRIRQWQIKRDLLKAHNAIMALNEWTPERLARVDNFWSVYEVLERQVWGLGPVRGCLSRESSNFAWYREWMQHR